MSIVSKVEMTLHQELKNRNTGLIIVNEELKVIFANTTAQNILELSRPFNTGSFGEVLICENQIPLKHECTVTKKCRNCKVRTGILLVIEFEKSISKLMINHRLLRDNHILEKWIEYNIDLVEIDNAKYVTMTFVDKTNERLPHFNNYS